MKLPKLLRHHRRRDRHLPGDRVDQRRPAALVGDVHDLRHIGQPLEQLAGEIRNRTGTRGAVVHAVLVLLRIGHELAEIGHGHARVDDDRRRRIADDGDWLEARDGIVGLVPEHRADDQFAGGAEQQRIAVRGRAGRGRRADNAAAAAHVLDKGRAQRLVDLPGPFPRDDIDDAAGGARHDEPDGAVRIGRLRRDASRQKRRRRRRRHRTARALDGSSAHLLSVHRTASRCRAPGSAPADRPSDRCRRRAAPGPRIRRG